jgi:galactose mutarotase-like enzyme
VWTKAHGAGFVCIEPWHGVADTGGFEGDITQKPGIVMIAAGAARTFAMTIELQSAS